MRFHLTAPCNLFTVNLFFTAPCNLFTVTCLRFSPGSKFAVWPVFTTVKSFTLFGTSNHNIPAVFRTLSINFFLQRLRMFTLRKTGTGQKLPELTSPYNQFFTALGTLFAGQLHLHFYLFGYLFCFNQFFLKRLVKFLDCRFPFSFPPGYLIQLILHLGCKIIVNNIRKIFH